LTISRPEMPIIQCQKKSIKIQQVPDERNDGDLVLLTDCTDTVPEPVPVECHHLEYECDTLRVEIILPIRGDYVGVREPCAAHTACQRYYKDNPVCATEDNRGSCPPLLVPFCIGEIDESDIAVFHRISTPAFLQLPSARFRSLSSGLQGSFVRG